MIIPIRLMIASMYVYCVFIYFLSIYCRWWLIIIIAACVIQDSGNAPESDRKRERKENLNHRHCMWLYMCFYHFSNPILFISINCAREKTELK